MGAALSVPTWLLNMVFRLLMPLVWRALSETIDGLQDSRSPVASRIAADGTGLYRAIARATAQPLGADAGAATSQMHRVLALVREAGRGEWRDAGWHHGNTVHAWTRRVAGSKFLMFLGQRRLRATPQKLMEMAAGIKHLAPLDPANLSSICLQEPSASAEGVFTSEVNFPNPLANRQIVWSEAVDLAIGGGATAAKAMVSTTHARQGEILRGRPATVLAEMLLGGWVFEPEAGGDLCLCSFLMHFDPKGSLPAFGPNGAVADQVAVLNILQQALELDERRKERPLMAGGAPRPSATRVPSGATRLAPGVPPAGTAPVPLVAGTALLELPRRP